MLTFGSDANRYTFECLYMDDHTHEVMISDQNNPCRYVDPINKEYIDRSVTLFFYLI